jgi:predicted CxxxxCH...CXXCH cytochrome family protein
MKMNSLLIAIICLLPCAAAAITVDPPHGGVASGYNCAHCHTTHAVLGGSGYDNICLNCHSPGSPKGGSRPFTSADAANPFSSMTGALPARMYQTSHNWSGPDSSPAAGAAPPRMAAMTSNRLAARTGNRLACVRCHNQHDNSIPLFLRMANDHDQLCLDCHRSRNVRSHTAGSHPVNFNYTGAGSKVRTNPAQFNNPPLNANPANPTADLGRAMAKTGGTLLCSSCHGVHYTDSSSATFDNHSGFYDLKQADGFLLRTDLHGDTADAINICTNCHAGKKAHNARGQNVQCADCHGAHVEFDGNATTTQQKKPNVWLVRRYMLISTAFGAAQRKPVYFQSTSVKNYKDATGNGVCQSCHEVPVGVGYPAEHGSTSTAVCNQCHFHDNTSGAFSALGACNTCHGYPPRANSAGGPNGYAVFNGTPSPFTNESSSGHATHAGGAPYSRQCVECHQGNSHRSGTFQDVFKDTTGQVSALFGAVPTFIGTNPQAPACANVYCHSDGAPRNAALVPVLTTKTIPLWANGRGAIVGQPDECRRCHGDATTLTTNSHGKHLASAIGCVTCHGATVSGNTALKGFALHANGVKNISFSGFTAAGRAGWDVTAATCATVYCHSSVQGTNGSGSPAVYAVPRWGGTAPDCSGCHRDMSGTAGTGGHIQHASLTGNNRYGCSTCHSGAGAGSTNHANQKIEISFSAPANPGGQYSLGATVTPGAGYGSCANTFCHGAGTPTWGLSSSVALCEKCHGSAATVPFYATSRATATNDAKAGAHTAHLNALTAGRQWSANIFCVECHAVPATVNVPGHIDSAAPAEILFGTLARTGGLNPQYSAATSSCSATWCHGAGLSGGDRPPVWNAPFPVGSSACGNCHAYVPPPQLVAAHAGIVSASQCNGCHPHVNQSGTGFTDPALHINGVIDVSFGCASCHGYPPATAGFSGTHGNWSSARVENYPGGGGAHTLGKHIKRGAIPSEGFANCTNCHSPIDHQMSPTVFVPSQNIKVKINQSLRLEPAKQARYTSNRLDGAAHQTGTCFNISCHFGATPKWDPSH